MPESESEFLRKWEVSNDIVKEFRAKFQLDSSGLDWVDEVLKVEMKSEVAKLFFGNKLALQIELMSDDFLNTSLLALAKQNIFAELK